MVGTNFRNPANRLRQVFELPVGDSYSIPANCFEEYSRTLNAMVSPFACECVVTNVFAKELAANHSLRIFNVSEPLFCPAGA